MKNIVIVAPTERESVFFVKNGVRTVHCGVGMAECAAATARLLVDSKPDLVILAGVAGTYTDDIVLGETVVVVSETIADLGRHCEKGGDSRSKRTFIPLFQKTYPVPVVPEGFRAVRSNTVNVAGGLLSVSASLEAEIENMEGAAFLAVCDAMGVAAMEVRSISNHVGERIRSKNMEIAANRLAIDLEVIVNRYLRA